MLKGLHQPMAGVTTQIDAEIIKQLSQHYFKKVSINMFQQEWLSNNWVKQINEWQDGIDEFFEHYTLRMRLVRPSTGKRKVQRKELVKQLCAEELRPRLKIC